MTFGDMHYLVLMLMLAVIAAYATWQWRKERVAHSESVKRAAEVVANPMLTGINIGNGSIDIGMQGPGPMLIAGMFVGMFEKHPDAKNYIECRMSSSMGEIIVTATKMGKLTPHMMLEHERRRRAADSLAMSAALEALETVALDAAHEADPEWSNSQNGMEVTAAIAALRKALEKSDG